MDAVGETRAHEAGVRVSLASTLWASGRSASKAEVSGSILERASRPFVRFREAEDESACCAYARGLLPTLRPGCGQPPKAKSKGIPPDPHPALDMDARAVSRSWALRGSCSDGVSWMSCMLGRALSEMPGPVRAGNGLMLRFRHCAVSVCGTPSEHGFIIGSV